ncbi:MAG: hemin-degrading factor [Deltaproteobacteria bacterium]|nr:hemin-degrading factor [Deltaproteobacteria bacterium]
MELHQQVESLLAQSPRTRPRDAARQLGVSEAALVASAVGRTATRLRPAWTELFRGFETLGEVMALTRNEAAVHERRGRYERVQLPEGAPVGGAFGEEIDLRLFPRRWHTVFATERAGHRAIQLFDHQGEAVHKVHLGETSDLGAFEALVNSLRDPDQTPFWTPGPETFPADPDDGELDAATFCDAWAAMGDPHHLHGLLRAHRVSRRRALQLIEGVHAHRLPTNVSGPLLQAAAEAQTPIMVFVGNPGCVQIHIGTVSRIKAVGEWMNVLDPRFNLHLREDLVAEAWQVRKPSAEGWVHSVELLDHKGEVIVLFFGKRKPGILERSDWRDLLARLPTM